jgi:hypothetical protein
MAIPHRYAAFNAESGAVNDPRAAFIAFIGDVRAALGTKIPIAGLIRLVGAKNALHLNHTFLFFRNFLFIFLQFCS